MRQGDPMKPLTKQFTIGRLRHHVLPLLGHRRVTEITPGDIERLVRNVAAGKTARDEKIGPRKRVIVRGGEGAARKVARDLSAVFSFAARREIVARNPCELAAIRKTEKRKPRFLTLQEVTRLGAALDRLEAEGMNAKALNIARLWVLTGCRRNKIAGLKWTEIDFAESALTLDDSKAGKSRRPLGDAAVALLKTIASEDCSEYVFPAERGERHYQGTKTMWSKIIRKAELPGVTPHTMGSTATSTGEALAFNGAILGHANMRSTEIYAHLQNDPSRRAANRVTKRTAAALAGGTVAAPRRSRKAGPTAVVSDDDFMRVLAERLAASGADADQLRAKIEKAISGK
jgi:integrase